MYIYIYIYIYKHTCRIQKPDIPRASRGGAAQGEAAGWGRDGQDGTPTNRFAQNTTVPRVPQASNTTVLNVFLEHEQRKSYANR